MAGQSACTSKKVVWFVISALVTFSAISLGSCSSPESEESGSSTGNKKINPIEASRTVEGDSFSINLTRLNETRHHVEQLDAWTAFSEDGLFGEGPTGPCPISWVGLWIICTQTISFEVEILRPTGQLVEAFEIENCAAGSYSCDLDPKGVLGGVEAIYIYRIQYQGNAFPEHRIRVLGPN